MGMENSTDHLEIEVKFHLKDETEMQRRLLELGAAQGPKVFESNTRFDDSRASLQNNGCLLRLRRDHTNRLTFKRKPANADREVKVFHELEVEIGEFDTMSAILDAIGFHPAQVYEKWRQTFTLPDAEICIDTMPYGVFLEIEGSKARIMAIADQLELPWEKRILSNYLSIFEMIRKDAQLPFADVTFDHFALHPVAIEPYLPILEVGSK
jgi:adenylate cyclase class 2